MSLDLSNPLKAPAEFQNDTIISTRDFDTAQNPVAMRLAA